MPFLYKDEGHDPYKYLFIRFDITERKRVEEALRQSEERYALAALAANDGLWDWDLESNEVYYSPRWKKMLGYEEDERDFKLAALMLEQLGIDTISLMTNNPTKIDVLKQLGIKVKQRVKLAADCSKHNQAYIEAKVKKSGHLF